MQVIKGAVLSACNQGDAKNAGNQAGGTLHGPKPLVLLRPRPPLRNAFAFLPAIRQAAGGLRAHTGSATGRGPNRRRIKHRLRPDGLVRNSRLFLMGDAKLVVIGPPPCSDRRPPRPQLRKDARDPLARVRAGLRPPRQPLRGCACCARCPSGLMARRAPRSCLLPSHTRSRWRLMQYR